MIPIKKLTATARMPTRATKRSAGLDLYADGSCVIPAGYRAKIPTGVSVAIPEDMAGFVWPRSGMAVKDGMDRLAGLIDSDYRGELNVVLQNHGQEPVVIQSGDRIAQLVIQPVEMLDPVEVQELPSTERGESGFGSSGT